jgi:hypothetical protein
MKIMKKVLPLLFLLVATFAGRATVLFSDNLNYPNGSIETDGLWFAVSSSPLTNTLVINDLLILTNASSFDSVAAPTNGLNNPTAPELFASFTINVSTLPSVAGNYFIDFMQTSTNGHSDFADVCHVFADRTGTTVPGTYRLGIANYATSLSTVGVTNFPVDLSTDVTYQVVILFAQNNDPLAGANIWINPASENDNSVFATDDTGSSSDQQNIYNTISNITAIEFSPYANAAIGNVSVGTQFSDVDNNTSFSPTFGIQPQSTNVYSGNFITLYGVASGIDVTYQWLSNSVPLTDDGATVFGSQSDALTLSNLETTANYSVVAYSSDGTVTSAVATVSVNTTPTSPIFTSVPPVLNTNFVDQTFTMSVAAVGTGPIAYQWYFSAAGSGVTNPISVTTPSYTITLATTNNAGSYYVAASNSAGTSNSAVFSIIVVQPPLVSIGSLHQYINFGNLNTGALLGGQLFDIEGVVTTVGTVFYGPGTSHPTYGEYFIQDGTGACAVFGESGSTNNPPVGTLVNVVTPIESFYGNLEMAYYQGGTVTVLATNVPVPAPQLLNFNLMATNPFTGYGSNIEESLVSITNVYLSSSATTYTAPTKNFPTNSSTLLYAWPSNVVYPGETNLEVEVYTYTNTLNQINTNYWGQPIPSHCSQITGLMYIYNPPAELVPTRFADFVSTPPAQFKTKMGLTNGVTTLSWPAVPGSTYSVYSSTNLLGPWTQTFGLGYYPSIGSYTDTNTAQAKFYQVTSP